MALNLGPLNVLLRLQGADKFKRDTRQITGGLDKLGKKIAGLLTIRAVGQQFMQATQVFAEFERGMVRVGAVTNSLGSTAFAGLTERAQDLAKTTEFTARQVADAMGFMGMAGMKTNQIFDATPAVLQLASAGMVDVASAADTVTNIMAGYGLKTEDLNNANNILVATFTNSNTSLQQLGQSFKYVGPVAKSAGVEFKEAAAVIGLMGNAGIQADMAGTALRGTIIKLLDPTAEGAKVMRQYGINVQDSNGKLKPMVEIFKQLEPIADDSAKMIQLFGLRAGPGMQAALTQGTDALQGLIEKIDGAGNIAERVATAQMETLDGKIKIMKSNAEALQIALGAALEPTSTAFVNALSQAAQFAQYIVEALAYAREDVADTSEVESAMSRLATQRAKATSQYQGLQKAIEGGFADVYMQEKLAGFANLSPEAALGGLEIQIAELTEKIAGLGKKAFNIKLPKPSAPTPVGGGGKKFLSEQERKKQFEQAEMAYRHQIAETPFESAAPGLVDVLAKIGYEGAIAVKASAKALFMPMTMSDVISPLAKAADELAKKQADAADAAAALSHKFDKAGEAVTSIGGAVVSGRAGSTFGPELGAMAGAAIAGAVSGGAATGLGSAIGGIVGELLGDALDELIKALGVLTPVFDFVADVIGTLQKPLVVMREMISSVATMLFKAFGPTLEGMANVTAKALYGVMILFQALAPILGTLTHLILELTLGAIVPIMDLITSAGIQLAEKALIPLARVVLQGYNAFVGFINGITFFLRNLEIGGVKPFKDFGVELDSVSTHVQTYADLMREETEAREESTQSLREFNEELTNVPTGIKRLRAFQFGAMQGSGRGTPFGQSAFGV